MSEQPPPGPYDQQGSWPTGEQPQQQPPGLYPGQPLYQGPPGGQPPPFPGPGYGHGPQPPRGPRRQTHWFRNILAGIGAVVVVSIVLSHLSSGGDGVSTTASATSGSASTSPSSAAPAGIGSSFDLQDSSGDAYRVTLVKVIDPAQSSNPYITPDNGTRFVAAVFTVKALSGSPQDEDANDDAALTGSNGQSYSATFASITGYTNFDNGVIHVAQGETVTGSVTFELPDRVKVVNVQWTTSAGFGSTTQWDVRAPADAAASPAHGASCRSQVSAWRSSGGPGRLEATFTGVEKLSSAATKLAKDTASSPDGASDQQAAQNTATTLESDIMAAERDPAPSCIPGLRHDVQAYFTDASATAEEVANAASAYGNAKFGEETQYFDLANSSAAKMDTELAAVNRDLKAYSNT